MVKISDEEVEFLWGITDEKEAAKKLLDEFGIRLAMITMGPKGAYLANQNGAAYAKCPEVKPIDTTGAGDIFGGSAVSRLLKAGKAPEEFSTEELVFRRKRRFWTGCKERQIRIFIEILLYTSSRSRYNSNVRAAGPDGQAAMTIL